MAFSSTIDLRTRAGARKLHYGTYTNADTSTTGGNIDTGLEICENLSIIPNAAAVETNAPVVNETFPVAGSAVTIVTDADADGYWIAIGR